jgi:CRP-like cAMP-binding protein
MIQHEWRTITLLTDADDAVLKAFDERGWPVSYAKGEPVLWEGDACRTVYFIISGMVEVYRTAIDGREHTLRVLRTGDSFNLVPALLKEGKNFANVRCLQQTDLLLTDKQDLKDILTRFPKFSLRVLQDLAERLAGMTELAGDLALKSVRQRTAAFMMRAAENNKNDKDQHWTQDDMARQVGTVRDVIGRTLREFEEKGLIKRNRGNISLIDRDGLEKTAKGLE